MLLKGIFGKFIFHSFPVKNLIKIILVLTVISACKKAEDYPVVPVITFKDFKVYKQADGTDSLGIFSFTFTDGDGDIGYKKSDTLAPYDRKGAYYYNFVIKYFEKIDGKFTEVELPLPISSRIPYLTPEGKNKTLEGEIQIDLFLNNPLAQSDTVRFDAFIYDRALHKSNVITTPDLLIKH